MTPEEIIYEAVGEGCWSDLPDTPTEITTSVLEALASHGYVIVPKTPTPAMLEAGAEEPVDHSWGRINTIRHPNYGSVNGEFICDASGVWDAMINAATPSKGETP